MTPSLGPGYTLLAFVIVITGGLGSMPGALLGGVLIGLTEALAGLAVHAVGQEHVLLRPFWSWCCCSGRRACSARGRHDTRGSLDGVCRARARDFARRRCWRRCWSRRWLANDYLLTVLILILYFAYTGQAWNIMMGFAGQLSLGHALYAGLGAYVAAVLFTRYGIGPWLGLLAAMPVAAACGAVIGFLAFRFGVAGVYFAILTIAFAEFARIGFDHLDFVSASAGLFLPVKQYAHNDLWRLRGSPTMFYYVILAATVLALRALPRSCCAAASAISGWRSARTSRRRAPPASIPSATRCTR